LPGIKIVKGLVSATGISACSFLLLTHSLTVLLQVLAVQLSELANKLVDLASSNIAAKNVMIKNVFMFINLFF
jgi:hypothetical protein